MFASSLGELGYVSGNGSRKPAAVAIDSEKLVVQIFSSLVEEDADVDSFRTFN